MANSKRGALYYAHQRQGAIRSGNQKDPWLTPSALAQNSQQHPVNRAHPRHGGKNDGLMVAIDLNGAAPPSEQIYQQLRGLILSGRIVAGERLPTVRQLARDLGVAPGTVARAYKQLELESSVQTRTGRHHRSKFIPKPFTRSAESGSRTARRGCPTWH